jgi:hypothetical protein
MSASYALLVSAVEALTPEDRTTHSVYCDKCNENRKRSSRNTPRPRVKGAPQQDVRIALEDSSWQRPHAT